MDNEAVGIVKDGVARFENPEVEADAFSLYKSLEAHNIPFHIAPFADNIVGRDILPAVAADTVDVDSERVEHRRNTRAVKLHLDIVEMQVYVIRI